MNKRERMLVIAVSGLFLAVGLQYGLSKYRAAKQRRDVQISSLQQQLTLAQERQLMGEEAMARMGDLQTRSLPSDLELARSEYSSLLTEMGTAAGLNDLRVSFMNRTPSGDLYDRFHFQVSGTGDLEELVWMLHAFHSKDYLHRISSLSVTPATGKNTLSIGMDIEALALSTAPPDLQPPPGPSPAVDPAVEAYKDVILNRNFFAPPNRAPEFAAKASVEAVLGEDFSYVAEFSDPDGHLVQYTLVSDSPEGVEIDDQSGRLRLKPERVGKIELTVRATDQGLPARSSEQTLVINVVDPPQGPKPKPEFDEASQTTLTAVVQSRGDWTAWLTPRTKGESIPVRQGDDFEIGSLHGTVVEVHHRGVVLEVDGRQFTLRPGGNLGEAVQASDLN